MKHPKKTINDHPHGGGLQKFASEPLGNRIARMLATHTVEAAIGVADYDDEPGKVTKSMDVRPDQDFHLDQFDRAEMMFEKGLSKLEQQTLQTEMAREAQATPVADPDPEE